MVHSRQTKYTLALKDYFNLNNHKTNLEAYCYLKKIYPNLKLTTVHRITNRFLEQGKLILAPSTLDHVRRLDSQTKPHDHFHCLNCDSLRDIQLSKEIISQLEELMDGCKISSSLTISGICQKCYDKKRRS